MQQIEIFDLIFLALVKVFAWLIIGVTAKDVIAVVMSDFRGIRWPMRKKRKCWAYASNAINVIYSKKIKLRKPLRQHNSKALIFKIVVCTLIWV